MEPALSAAGLVVIGVHTPEFEFAKNPESVADAVKRFGFDFPVAIDSDYQIWNAFQNEGWPADYLIDKNGNVAYIHLGEGDYGDFELEIHELLKEANPARLLVPRYRSRGRQCGYVRLGLLAATPETYLGFAQSRNIANPSGEDHPKRQPIRPRRRLPLDSFALDGAWLAEAESVRHAEPSRTPGLRWICITRRRQFISWRVPTTRNHGGSSLRRTEAVAQGCVGSRRKGRAARTDLHQSGRQADVLRRGERRVWRPFTGLYATEPGVSLYSFTFGNNCENKFAHS